MYLVILGNANIHRCLYAWLHTMRQTESCHRLVAHLEPHVSCMPLQLLPQLLFWQLFNVQDWVLPFDLLHAVWVVRYVLADLHFAQCVPVTLIGSLKLLQQISKCTVLQRLEHQVHTPADPESPEPAAAVDPQHNVAEVAPWELSFKADGEALHSYHAVGEVTGV